MRQSVLEALDKRNGNYFLAYSSESYIGLASAVRAGLAVTAMAESGIPDDFRILSAADGFPDLPSTALGVLRRAGNDNRAIDSFHAHLIAAFDTGGALTGPGRTPARERNR